MKTEYYKISGMSCAACSSSVEKATKRLKGVSQSSVNLVAEKLTISYDETLLNSEEIIKKVESIGFGIEKLEEGESAFKKEPKSFVKEYKEINNKLPRAPKKTEIILALIFSCVLLLISMGPMLIKSMSLPAIISPKLNPLNYALCQMLLAFLVMYIGKKYFISGFLSLWHRAPSMDALVALSCSCSFLFSLVQTLLINKDSSYVHNLYFESSAVVLALVMLGKYLESSNKEKTKEVIKGLLTLAPDTAFLVGESGEISEIPASSLNPGDLVLVKPGNRIPADGKVEKGFGSVDESMFTGESLPVNKEDGCDLIGGSLSLNGALYERITKVGKDTALSQIIRFVEEAQGKKAPIAKLADQVAGVFVPVIIGIAFISAIIWLLAGQSFAFALKVFTAVLVIACPCALGLATPTAIIVGTGLGASNGILIRSGEALEKIAKAKIVVLDKTGTLTFGKPVVTDVFAEEKEKLLAICSAAEKLSDHPLAKAIVEKFEEEKNNSPKSFENLEIPKISDWNYVPGKGVVCYLDEEKKLICGNLSLLEDEEIEADEDCLEFFENCSRKGKSIIFAAIDKKVLGALAISDTVKPDAKKALDKLKSMGLKTIVLTGDSMYAAKYITELVGADRVIAGVLPNEKAFVIEELQKNSPGVIMVGDGINDAPALVQADVGCAIGKGSDIAIDSADVVLMKDELLSIAKAIKLSKLTIKNIKQNLFWAFFYNCIGVPIAAGALYPATKMLLSPMIGGLAMGCSSFFVVSNALSLKKKKLE